MNYFVGKLGRIFVISIRENHMNSISYFKIKNIRNSSEQNCGMKKEKINE